MRSRIQKSVLMLIIFALFSCSLFATDKKSDLDVKGDVRITVDLDFGTIRIGKPPKKAPPPPPKKNPPTPRAHNPPPPPPSRCPPPFPAHIRHRGYRRSVKRVVVDPTKPLPPSTHFYPDLYGDTETQKK